MLGEVVRRGIEAECIRSTGRSEVVLFCADMDLVRIWRKNVTIEFKN